MAAVNTMETSVCKLIKLPVHRYLDDLDLKRFRSPGDGHCLMHSLSYSLDSQVKYTISSLDLLWKCQTELVQNVEGYRSFYSGKNLLSEFDEYAKNKTSNLEVVDIVLQVIANTIKMNVIVADVRAEDRIIETVFRPTSRPTKEQAVYILRNGQHYDGLIKATCTRKREHSDSQDKWGEAEPGVVLLNPGNFPYRSFKESECIVTNADKQDKTKTKSKKIKPEIIVLSSGESGMESSDAESSDETKEDEKVKKETKGCMSDPELFVIDSSDDENENNEKPCYYKENITMPVFQFGKYSPTYPDLFDILVESPDLNLICTKLPSLVEDNLAFVLSTKESDIPLSDIQCDGHTGDRGEKR